MNLLDMRTLVFGYVVTNIICVGIVVLLWRQSRDRFKGIGLLVIDFIFQASALILIVLRGAIPDWISIVLSNTLVVAGAILGFMGQEHFVEKKGPQIHNYLLLTLFVFVHGYFTFVQPSLAVRNINIASALLLVCLQSVWLMWHRVEPGLRSITFGVGLVNFLYCLVSVVRILQFLVGVHLETDYFRSGLFEALVLVSHQVLFILLTYSLVLMVNKRLFMQIGTQEEKFAKAFHSAPYAITLTRPSDGKIVEVNETFFSITGYDRTEVVGKSTVDLRLWEHDQDRAAAVDALLKTGKVHGKEFSFRRKNGEALTGLFSAEVITIDGEKNILSSIGDITARKQAEEKVKASLREKETLLKEIHHRVKNNLTVISSLLDLQSSCLQDEKAREALQNSIERVKTMASIHTQLYQSQDLNRVDFGLFIRDLIGSISQSYGRAESPVEIHVDANEIRLGIDASIPCGLILNELVTNALKHAFPEGKEGKINITMQSEENQLVLKVSDNGIGFSEPVDLTKTKSLGLELVNILVGQMNGKIEMHVDGGTTWTITLPLKEERKWRNG